MLARFSVFVATIFCFSPSLARSISYLFSFLFVVYLLFLVLFLVLSRFLLSSVFYSLVCFVFIVTVVDLFVLWSRLSVGSASSSWSNCPSAFPLILFPFHLSFSAWIISRDINKTWRSCGPSGVLGLERVELKLRLRVSKQTKLRKMATETNEKESKMQKGRKEGFWKWPWLGHSWLVKSKLKSTIRVEISSQGFSTQFNADQNDPTKQKRKRKGPTANS